MSQTSPITTHVLDTSTGRPAAGLAVTLARLEHGGAWQPLASGVTNADGRLASLLPPGTLVAGTYRLQFATGEYYQRQSLRTFYPSVAIEFMVNEPTEHYHVPLLLSPCGYTTYRGS